MIKFVTETGSVWTVDDASKKWERPKNPRSKGLRTDYGYFYFRSLIAVGQKVVFMCPPLIPDSTAREVTTSKVVKILES